MYVLEGGTRKDSGVPQVLRTGLFDTQVCVPSEWSDDQVKSFADSVNPSGTTHGWMIRRQGDEALNGDPERRQCAKREGWVHIVLDA